MISNTIAKLGFRYLGSYNPADTYKLQDVVEYNGSTYVHESVSSVGSTPSSLSDWAMLSESTQSVSGTTGQLIARDSSNLITISSGNTGEILTATSKSIYTFTVTVNAGQYEFDGSTSLPDLVEGDQLILNVTPGIVTGSPIIFGKDATTFLTSTNGIRYIVNDLQFNNVNDYVRYAKTNGIVSCRIVWDIPEDYTTLVSSTVVWMDYDGVVAGNLTNVYDSASSPNSIVLKWREYANESPRKVARFPNNIHCSAEKFAAFVMMDNSIRTIGSGSTYRHGNGTNEDREQPSLVGLSNTITGISSFVLGPDTGLNYLVDTSGKLWVWGQSYIGESGYTGAKIFKTPTDITSRVLSQSGCSAGASILDVCEVLPSNNTNGISMVRVLDGSTIHLVAAGFNGSGQLGVVNNSTNQNTWKKVVASNITSPIAKMLGTSGDMRTFFAIDTAGLVYSWGSNAYGTLGTESTTSFNIFHTAKHVTGLNPISKLFVSRHSAYAIDNTNDLYAWGRNDFGNLGLGDTIDRSTPEYVMSDVAEVFTSAMNYETVFVLKTDGTILSAGDGSYGSSAQGTTGDLQTFIPVTLEDGSVLSNVTKVSISSTTSRKSTAVLTADGTVYTCGYNNEGQLGLGNTDHYDRLQEVPIRQTVIDLQWFGVDDETALTLLTEENDVFICGSGIEGLNTQYSGNMRLVPTPIIF